MHGEENGVGGIEAEGQIDAAVVYVVVLQCCWLLAENEIMNSSRNKGLDGGNEMQQMVYHQVVMGREMVKELSKDSGIAVVAAIEVKLALIITDG
ncbi:hypothetical protein C5167_014361 [Papaver somniferum]|uniref:Uncharacterized protein n=1 Tax=Papaver somniferum TaxID=3469 RepID=A0A4Y7J6E3_PAPSO|nr:hypothetical protein C5167_014361 [Papaver somniferum]